jgi:iron complex outermembrane receptor protein
LRLDTSRDPLLEDPLGLTPAQWREDPLQINTAAELFNTRKSVSHRQASLTLRQSEGIGRWQGSVWQGSREISQYLGFTGEAIGGAGGVVDLQRDFYGASGNYSRDFLWQETLITATLGGEVANMEDRRRGFVNDFGVAGDLRRDELGEVSSRDVYSILQWQASNHLQFYGGARHSDLEFEVDDYFIVAGNPDDSGARDFAEWSSAFGANYVLTENWILFGSAGRGFETPTLTEMAYRSDDSSGLNLGLDAAENRQRELGVRYRESDVTEFAITMFGVDSIDEIVVDQSVGGRTTYRNAAGTERKGIELSGQINFAPAWLARINMNYLDAEYSQGEWQGNRLPGVAKHNHYAQLRWQPLLDERLTLAVAMLHRSKVAAGDSNQDFAPAATTADIALSSRQGFGDWQFNAWIKVSNLTDKNYVGSVIVNQGNGRSFEPAPGRNVNAGLEVGYRW